MFLYNIFIVAMYLVDPNSVAMKSQLMFPTF